MKRIVFVGVLTSTVMIVGCLLFHFGIREQWWASTGLLIAFLGGFVSGTLRLETR